MAEGPAYVILGRGRWAQRMGPIIAAENRAVSHVDTTRQSPGEGESVYRARLTAALRASGAQVAWLCVTPGPHVPQMIEAAFEAGLHVVAEKPWFGSRQETERLQSLAIRERRLAAVHFEYLVLTEVEKWKAEFYPGEGLQFRGRFLLSRSDQSGISPLDNLGCHLLAIREYSSPYSQLAELECAYERSDERRVWLERSGRRVASIDLFHHGEPIIQRFMKKVEAALEGAAFPFDLDFAYRVQEQLATYKARSAT